MADFNDKLNEFNDTADSTGDFDQQDIQNNKIMGILDGLPLIGWIFSIAGSLLGLFCLLFAVLGIINAANGKAKELPIIGKFKILK